MRMRQAENVALALSSNASLATVQSIRQRSGECFTRGIRRYNRPTVAKIWPRGSAAEMRDFDNVLAVV